MNVQLTLTHHDDVGLTPVLRFSGVVLQMEHCENAHYSFWREKPFHLITLLAISTAECLVANKIFVFCILNTFEIVWKWSICSFGKKSKCSISIIFSNT